MLVHDCHCKTHFPKVGAVYVPITGNKHFICPIGGAEKARDVPEKSE